MAKAVAEDSGDVMPVCTWVDGEYGIDGVYLGVEAELGAGGVRRVVERDLTETELEGLKAAAEAVRSKAGDVASPLSAAARAGAAVPGQPGSAAPEPFRGAVGGRTRADVSHVADGRAEILRPRGVASEVS